MKKDQRFLSELEENLKRIGKKDREKIVLKYKNIIEEKKANKEKIKYIIKDLGEPSEVAKKEIKLLKSNKKVPSFFPTLKNICLELVEKIKKLFKKKTKTKKLKKEKKSKVKSKREFNIKEKINELLKKIKPKKKTKKIVEETKVKVTEVCDEAKEDITETCDEVVEKVNEVIEHKFETKKQKIIRILLRTLGSILIGILVFIWLWITVLFFASIFGVLDGIKLYGLNITLLGLVLLFLWFIVMLAKKTFKKKIKFKLSLILMLVFVVITGFGIALFLNEISKIENINDVSIKYSMSRQLETYRLPKDENKKLHIVFNSNYDTQYIIEENEQLKDKINVEVKYYECYYDYFTKESTNNVYISLKLDTKDRLSVYINDLKEGKIFDADELSRYTVKITGSKKDLERVVIDD